MTKFIAALPMYDWPERRAEVDAEWALVRDRLRNAGVDAPDGLTRNLEEHELWRHPDLLFAQACWGPMERGLAEHVQVVGQPSYDGIEGGAAEFYSSAVVMRASTLWGSAGRARPVARPDGLSCEANPDGGLQNEHTPTPTLRADPPHKGEGTAVPPVELIRNTRFTYNGPDSMSGIIGLTRDLEALGESLDIFSTQIVSGGHRNSVKAVAEGRADVAAIDCMSWHLAKLYEPAAQELQVVGWTAKRKGLPFVTAKTTSLEIVAVLRRILTELQIGESRTAG